MNYSASRIVTDADFTNQDRLVKLGAILELVTGQPAYSQLSMQTMLKRLRVALDLGQVEVLLNAYGQCVGFVVWALLSPDVEAALIRGDQSNLHPWEWREGDRLWVLDAAFYHGSLHSALHHLLTERFSEYQDVTYVRRRAGGLQVRRISRQALCTFFSRRAHR